MKAIKAGILSLIAMGLLTWDARADINIDNWSITTDTVSFDVVGTIDSDDPIGTDLLGWLIIGAENDTDWIASDVFNSGVFTFHGGNRTAVSQDYLVDWTSDSDHIRFYFGSALSIGDSFDFSYTATSPGLFAPGNIDTNDLIVTIHRNTDFLAASDAVGGVIPEPSSVLLLALGSGGVGLIRRLFLM